MKKAPLKIGLLGAGHLGKIHLRCLRELPEIWELIGFFDPNDAAADKVEADFGLRRFTDLDEFFSRIEVVDIVTPTVFHFEMAEKAIRAGLHFFIEKPLTETVGEGKRLLDMAKTAGIQAQVGHVERFNPAFLSIKNVAVAPMFIEGHRLAAFSPRGTDVSVVLDLMIHDIDLVLSLVCSPVVAISASGVAVLSDQPDIANARIEFENGCVANLTASRISLKQMRKMRLFQPDAYLSLDFLEKTSQVVRLFEPGSPEIPDGATGIELDTPKGKRVIFADSPEAQPVNAIRLELEVFGRAILENCDPPVPLADGLRALEVAHEILAKISERQARFG